MNDNALLIEKLFTSLDKHDHQSMADCYDANAKFTDIAFDLTGKKQIHAMWHLICEGDIHTTLISFEADDQNGKAELVDEYTFSDTGRPVKNTISSNFKFENGLIVEHHDSCDAEDWAAQAIGGLIGFLAGKLGFLRRLKAAKKLRKFIEKNPQYTLSG